MMRRMVGFVAAVLVGALTMAAAVIAADHPADWITLPFAGGLRVQAPPGSTNDAAAGIDSATGTIRGPGFSCFYDYGPYANPLTDMGGSAEALTLAGRAARLVRADPDFDGLHIPDTGTGKGMTMKLTLACRSPNPARRAEVRQVLRSIELK